MGMELTDILAIVMWGLPLVFGAGSLYFSIQTLQKRVETLEKRFDEHVAKPGHDISMEQLKQLQKSQEVVFTKLDTYAAQLHVATTKIVEVVAFAEAERKQASKT